MFVLRIREFHREIGEKAPCASYKNVLDLPPTVLIPENRAVYHVE